MSTDPIITSETLFLDAPRPAPARQIGAVAIGNVLVAIGYIASGYAGLALAFIGHTVTLFWPPSGIAFAALWLGGRRYLPAVAVGAFVVNLVTALPAGLAGVIAVGNTASALAACAGVRWAVTRRRHAGELWRVFWFILLAVLGATMLSASLGTIAVQMLPLQEGTPVATWFVWWLGDAMGMLIVAPPVLLWRRTLAAPHRWRDLIDAVGFAAVGAGIIAGLALIHQPLWAVELCKLFTLLLSLWAGARFGLNGPAAITLLMAVAAVAVTTMGVGPFARGDFYDSFALVHSYLFAEAVAGMLLAAAIADLRRAIRRERRALELAEAASDARIRLLTMIGHDVRQPLNGVVGAFQLLNRAPLADGERHWVELGLRAGATIGALVTDILSIARLEIGAIALHPAPFDPRRSLRDVVDLHQHEATMKGLALELALDDALPPAVLGDRVRFEQLVGNLIDNAVGYTPSGRVAVSAHWGDVLRVNVADTGPGIAADVAPYIFDAFTRVDRGRATGLGLGLHICRQLATLMEGRIGYTPGRGGGSCFHLELPLPAATVPSAVPAPAALADPPRRVLLVEDDPIAREIAEALLASYGHHVTVLTHAEEAAARVAAGGIDLVLMDIETGLDSMDGVAATRAIRALHSSARDVTVLALTGDAVGLRHRGFADAGMDGVLVKPLTLEGGLAAAIARAREAAASV